MKHSDHRAMCCVCLKTICLTETKVIFVTLLYLFLITACTGPWQVIFEGKLSAFIIFKPWKFNITLWTIVAYVIQNVPKPTIYKKPHQISVCVYQVYQAAPWPADAGLCCHPRCTPLHQAEPSSEAWPPPLPYLPSGCLRRWNYALW